MEQLSFLNDRVICILTRRKDSILGVPVCACVGIVKARMGGGDKYSPPQRIDQILSWVGCFLEQWNDWESAIGTLYMVPLLC